ncbi:FG-GAP repeat protein [Streptomyces sp. SAS_270]|uniref:FG-GAP repeat protein n=1 Tax=Streptomyces sp. SAS_270 TaxID=3412748 RepID=UPI00403CD55E
MTSTSHTPDSTDALRGATRATRSRRGAASAVAAASFLLLAGAGIIAAPAAQAGVPGGTRADDRNSDFDGDGYNDVLIGAPDGTVAGKKGAGYVTVQYGAANGMGTNASVPGARTAVFSQSTAGVPGTSEAYDSFGAAVATGDLDGDGFDDAVIGAPGEDVGSTENAGHVTVLYGSKTGLKAQRSASFSSAHRTAGARFGQAVTAARFTGATYGDEIAVLDQSGAQVYTYDQGVLRRTAGIDTTGHPADRVINPAYLTTGDYDKNGYADLVISGYTPDADYAQGWSTVFSGGAHGLTHVRDLRGGVSSASGDLNKDGYDDLVVGQSSSQDAEAEGMTGGLVAVYYGSPEGPADYEGPGNGPQWWHQNTSGVPGAGEHGDAWGADLSVADVNGDGYADLAVGAPGEDVGTVRDAGAVWVLRGSSAGLTTTGAQSFDQNSPDVPGTAETDDEWGAQVRLADTDANGLFDLVAAAPSENYSDGVVWVLPASTRGLVADGSWTYGGGALGASGSGARFGAAIDE